MNPWTMPSSRTVRARHARGPKPLAIQLALVDEWIELRIMAGAPSLNVSARNGDAYGWRIGVFRGLEAGAQKNCISDLVSPYPSANRSNEGSDSSRSSAG